jgi:GntR family transcriptional regulator/MocR family aminotransferase
MTRPLSKPPAFEFGIDRHDPEPLQMQIAKQLRGLVLSGRLKPESRLPSTRTLAGDLDVARATVVEAYEQLKSEGYLDTRTGSGTRIAAELPEILLSSPSRGRIAGLAKREPSEVRERGRCFSTGLVDTRHFPFDDWGRLMGQVWRNPPSSLLRPVDAFGWPPLREAIARHLHEWRGLACSPGQVIITAGGYDALGLVCGAVLSKGDRIWIEDPGYQTAHAVLRARGMQPFFVPVDAEGLLVQRGRALSRKARAAFVTPARHYPTGVTMPLARRLELLDWAEAADALVIEDDYDSEYRYVGRPLPALMSLDQRGRVISMGSFSKVFLPALRLGFLVVPEKLIVRFREERALHGTSPSLIAQPALAEFMNAGLFGTHIRRMRRIYASRRKALLSALAPGDGRLYTIDAAPSGLTLLLRLKPDQDDKAIVRRLEQAGIETQPLSGHFAGRGSDQGLLLGFAGFDEAELQRAAKRLLGELSKC